MRRYLSFTAFLLCFLVLACTPQPGNDDAVRDAIVSHFTGRGYAVDQLSLGQMKLVDRGQGYGRDKMYRVTVEELHLLVERQMPPDSDVRQGQMLTFRGATVTLKEPRTGRDSYEVTRVEGVPLL